MHVFLDFEASSLNKDSYPIEVGWVDEAGQGEAHLIRPAPLWTEWDETAEAVHGISRARLVEAGEAHDLVCARLIEVFAGNTVYASAPSWDGHWLSMLLRAAGHPRHLLRLRDSDEALIEAARTRLGADAEPQALQVLITETRRDIDAQPVEHRALADARREWSIWQRLVTGQA